MSFPVDRVDTRTALARYVRTRLLREEHEYAAKHGRGYRRLVSEKSGISQPHISNLLNREHMGVGMDVAEGLAKFWKMAGGYSELIRVALDWTKAQPAEEPAPRLQNLETAIVVLRDKGPVPDEAVAEMRRLGAASARDWSVGAWMILLGEAVQAAQASPPRVLPPSRRPRAAS